MFNEQQIKALPEVMSKTDVIEAINLMNDFYLSLIFFVIVFTFVLTYLISDEVNYFLEYKLNPYLRKKLNQAKQKKQNQAVRAQPIKPTPNPKPGTKAKTTITNQIQKTERTS